MHYIQKYISRVTVIICILSVFCFEAVAAQPQVSIVTIGPGDEVYELEGHTLLRITDGENTDMGISWGVFDFDSPNFIYRFVKGETDYKAVAYPWQYLLQSYAHSGRSVDEQILNLTQEETERLIEAVKRNLLPENSTYRYNYVKDNCATRPLSLVEKAIGGHLSSPVDSITNHTWRSEMTRFHSYYPWYQFGIDLALGSGIDSPITTRETCYSPVNLYSYLSTVNRPDGQPLVAESRRLLPETLTYESTPAYFTPLVVSWLFLMLTMWISMRSIARRQVNRMFTTILYGLSSAAGLVLTFLIFISVHEATSPNWLYLWINPFGLIPTIGIWLKKYNRVVYLYQIVNFAFLIVLLLIGIFDIQALNPAFYPLIASYLVYSATYIYMYRCH